MSITPLTPGSQPPMNQAVQPAPATGSVTRKGLLAEFSVPLVMLAFALYLIIGMFTMRIPEGTSFPGPRFFPAIIAGALVVLVIVQSVVILRERTPVKTSRALPPGIDDVEGTLTTAERNPGVNLPAFAWIVGGFAVFALLIEILGWIVAAGALFWAVARGFGSQAPARDAVVGLTCSSIAYIAFDMTLGLSLPSGILGWGF